MNLSDWLDQYLSIRLWDNICYGWILFAIPLRRKSDSTHRSFYPHADINHISRPNKNIFVMIINLNYSTTSIQDIIHMRVSLASRARGHSEGECFIHPIHSNRTIFQGMATSGRRYTNKKNKNNLSLSLNRISLCIG